MTPLRQRMLDELQRRNYTPDTIRGHIHAIKDFAEYFGKSPELMGADEVREFQLYMIREKKLALGTVALRMCALRFLCRKTLRRRDIDIDDILFNWHSDYFSTGIDNYARVMPLTSILRHTAAFKTHSS